MVIENFELTLNQTHLNRGTLMRQPHENYALSPSACVNITPSVTIKIFIFILKKQRVSLLPISCARIKIEKGPQKST